MRPHASLLTIGLFFICFCCSGATCSRRNPAFSYAAPPLVFQQAPTTAQLAEVINRTDQITKLQSNSATIQLLTMSAIPRLNANIAIERPKRISIRASIPFLPTDGLNLGSNEQFYWMRIPEGTGTSLYFAPHSEQLGSYRSDLLSVEPLWLIDALGLARIDLSIPHTEPVPRSDGLLEIRSAAIVGGNVGQRVLLIDAQTGVIKNQSLLGGDGQPRAVAEASQFEYFPIGQYSLPHRVRLSLQAGGQPMEMQIDISDWKINQLLTEDPNLFAMPDNASDRKINVSSASATSPLNAPPRLGNTAGYVSQIPIGPSLRGIERR